MKLALFTIAACFAIAGCAPQILGTTTTKSYQVGQRLKAAPGGEILSAETGSVSTVKRWVGVLKSPDGWETTTVKNSGYIRRELLYSGISGATIELSYREYRGGLAAPAFFQTTKYDLAASREISFQNFRFRVDSADNNGMTGVLLSDGITTASNPTPPPDQKPGAAGKDVFQAEALARNQSCATKPAASLTGSGPGFETYNVPCSGGDILTIRCEFGNCRVLR